MVELEAEAAASFSGSVGEHGDAGVLGSRVDTDLNAVDLRLGDGAVFDPDGERSKTVYNGPAFGQELAGPGRCAGL